ncbi:hypothetical protein FB451DRAFT_1184514 [Mycena latifolia]|nr:hypothetical protein FB451DRAFT_1184514 [Mycena latifolia]
MQKTVRVNPTISGIPNGSKPTGMVAVAWVGIVGTVGTNRLEISQFLIFVRPATGGYVRSVAHKFNMLSAFREGSVHAWCIKRACPATYARFPRHVTTIPPLCYHAAKFYALIYDLSGMSGKDFE